MTYFDGRRHPLNLATWDEPTDIIVRVLMPDTYASPPPWHATVETQRKGTVTSAERMTVTRTEAVGTMGLDWLPDRMVDAVARGRCWAQATRGSRS